MERAAILLMLLLGLIGLVAMLVLSDKDKPFDPEPIPEREGPPIEPGLEVTAPPLEEPPSEDVPLDAPMPTEPPATPKRNHVVTRGVVVDEEGKPLKGAVVHYRKRFGGDGFESALVSNQGTFEIPWEPEGSDLVLLAAASKWSFPMERDDVSGLTRAGRQDVRLVAKRGETLSVKVTGFEDVPHPEIPVQICQWDRETRVYLRTMLGAKGTASFSGIDPDGGIYLVHVGPAEVGRCARGEWRGAGGTFELELKPAEQIRGRIETTWDGVRVTVIDATGFRFDAYVLNDDDTFEVDGIEPNLAWCFAHAWVIRHFHKTPQLRCRPGDRDVVLKFDEEEGR